MSEKRLDDKNRWRNVVVAFRMSQEEAQELNVKVALSGLSKQDYIIQCLLKHEIRVVGGMKVARKVRVTADKDAGEQVVESVKVLVPKAIVSGVIVKEDLGDAELGKQIDEEKYTHEGDVVIKLSTPYDAAYVDGENAGIAIPSFCAAIRITDNDKLDARECYQK